MDSSRRAALVKALGELPICVVPATWTLVVRVYAAALEALERECKHDHWTPAKGMLTCQEASCRSVCKFCAALAQAETLADAVLGIGKEETE